MDGTKLFFMPLKRLVISIIKTQGFPFMLIIILMSGLVLSSCSEKEEIPSDGLILYYPFNGSINDKSDNHNNGINFTSDKYVSGINKQALDFNGISDFIKLSETINSSAGLSFSFWINSRGANGTENNGAIISKYNMTTNSRCFLIYSFGSFDTRTDNRLSAAFYKNGSSALIHDNVKSYMEPGELSIYPSDPSLWTIANPMRLVLGTWTHCVVNVTSTTIEAWINGVLCTKKEREYNTYFNSPGEPVYIGNNPSMGEGSNNHFNGILDELRIYNRGLSKKEIQILFNHR